jgi:hypothetical protein
MGTAKTHPPRLTASHLVQSRRPQRVLPFGRWSLTTQVMLAEPFEMV